MIVTGTATITSLGTTPSGIKREVVFQSAGAVITNSTAIILPNAANITVAAGDVFTFRSLGSGNWRMVGPRSRIAAADIADLSTVLAAYLPIAGGTLTGRVATAATTGVIANATGALGKVAVIGAAGANAAYLEFARTGSFGGYLGLDTDNAWKVGGYSAGAVANRLVHEGLATVNLSALNATNIGATSVTTSGGIAATGIIAGHNQITTDGAGGGFTFSDRTNIFSTAQWYATTGSARLFANGGAGDMITVSLVNGNTTVTGTWTGPNFIATSDRRKKKYIKKRKARQDLADRLNFVSFTWKKDNRPDLGVVADEVLKVAPEYVYESDDGILGVDKAMLALEAVIGLAARVRALEGK